MEERANRNEPDLNQPAKVKPLGKPYFERTLEEVVSVVVENYAYTVEQALDEPYVVLHHLYEVAMWKHNYNLYNTAFFRSPL